MILYCSTIDEERSLAARRLKYAGTMDSSMFQLDAYHPLDEVRYKICKLKNYFRIGNQYRRDFHEGNCLENNISELVERSFDISGED